MGGTQNCSERPHLTGSPSAFTIYSRLLNTFFENIIFLTRCYNLKWVYSLTQSSYESKTFQYSFNILIFYLVETVQY